MDSPLRAVWRNAGNGKFLLTKMRENSSSPRLLPTPQTRALFCFQSHRWWHRKASVSLKQQEKPLGVGDLNCNALALHTVHGGGLGGRKVLKEKGNWQTVGITQLKQRLRGWETGKSVNSRRRDLGHHTYLFCSGASCVKWWLWFYPKLCRTCAWLVW